jgi:DNA modification methylase
MRNFGVTQKLKILKKDNNIFKMRDLINSATTNISDQQVEILERFKGAAEKGSLINFKNICCGYQRDYYTNLIHSYPAKMYGPIARSLICMYAKKGDTVLDPYCGTGTVLMQSCLYGMSSIGIDINPIACLIAKVKTTRLNITRLKKETENLFYLIENAEKEVKIPTFPSIEYWFEKDVQADLARILTEINKISNKNYKNFFLICLSSIIRKASNADPEIKPPVKTKKMIDFINRGGKVCAVKEFKKAVTSNLDRLEKFCKDSSKSVKARVINEDFRETEIPNNSIDFVITSPPYIGSQKYIRSTKLENLWLNLANPNKLRDLDHKTIGTENVISSDVKIDKLGIPCADRLIKKIRQRDKERAYLVYKYFFDMEESIQKIFRILKKDKYIILVIGDNTIRGYYIPTHRILSEILIKNGFVKDRILKDKIKYRGFMKKRNQTAGIIDYEWILIFRK